jgi:hypothetical protein
MFLNSKVKSTKFESSCQIFDSRPTENGLLISCQSQCSQLKEALRDLKARIEAHPSLRQDQKEEAAGEVLQNTVPRRIYPRPSPMPSLHKPTSRGCANVDLPVPGGPIIKKLLQTLLADRLFLYPRDTDWLLGVLLDDFTNERNLAPRTRHN